jgi:hypothetical protein
VQPLAAGRQLVGFGRKARRDEPGREGTLQHVGLDRPRGRRRKAPLVLGTPVRTVLSGLVTDPAMETWYHRSIA